MASAMSRGFKVVVMTQQEWLIHPDRAIANGKPGLSDGVKPWINVQFSDTKWAGDNANPASRERPTTFKGVSID